MVDRTKLAIVTDWPPNIDELRKHFTPGSYTVFTYGDTLYNPHAHDLPEHILRHEETHARQQLQPALWWERYVNEPSFRYEQELEAYRAQYAFIKTEVHDRNKLYDIAYRLASELSGPMYGNIVSGAVALKAIRA
jgi:hypothetical protein